MSEIDFEKIEESIKNSGWFYFGEKDFECPGVGEKEKDFYMKNNLLPPPCDSCYKALLFWESNYSRENLMNLFSLIDSIEDSCKGKLNKGVVVVYFRKKAQMMKFLKNLKNKMHEYGVKGKIQWRRACKEYQDIKPELWKNAKEFIGIKKSNLKTLDDF